MASKVPLSAIDEFLTVWRDNLGDCLCHLAQTPISFPLPETLLELTEATFTNYAPIPFAFNAGFTDFAAGRYYVGPVLSFVPSPTFEEQIGAFFYTDADGDFFFIQEFTDPSDSDKPLVLRPHIACRWQANIF